MSGGQTYGGGKKGAETQTGQKEAAREHEGACGRAQTQRSTGAVPGGETYGGRSVGGEQRKRQKGAEREHEGACGAGQTGQDARYQTQV